MAVVFIIGHGRFAICLKKHIERGSVSIGFKRLNFQIFLFQPLNLGADFVFCHGHKIYSDLKLTNFPSIDPIAANVKAEKAMYVVGIEAKLAIKKTLHLIASDLAINGRIQMRADITRRGFNLARDMFCNHFGGAFGSKAEFCGDCEKFGFGFHLLNSQALIGYSLSLIANSCPVKCKP